MPHVHGRRLGNRGAALWWVGWHPVVTPVVGAGAGLALGNAVAVAVELLLGVDVLLTMAVGTGLGACVGLLAWYRGTRAVNRDFETVVRSVGKGARPTEDGSSTFVLLGEGTGSRPLVEPSRRYEATLLTLESAALDVHHGTFDLVNRQPVFGEDGMRLPYDHIETVSYDGSELSIETTENDRFGYPASSEPVELVRALRDRITC